MIAKAQRNRFMRPGEYVPGCDCGCCLEAASAAGDKWALRILRQQRSAGMPLVFLRWEDLGADTKNIKKKREGASIRPKYAKVLAFPAVTH